MPNQTNTCSQFSQYPKMYMLDKWCLFLCLGDEFLKIFKPNCQDSMLASLPTCCCTLVPNFSPFQVRYLKKWCPHGVDVSKEGFSDEKRGEWPKTEQTTMDWGMICHPCAHCDMTPWLVWVFIFSSWWHGVPMVEMCRKRGFRTKRGGMAKNWPNHHGLGQDLEPLCTLWY